MWFAKKAAEGNTLIHNRQKPVRRGDFALSTVGIGLLAALVAIVFVSLRFSGKRPTAMELALLLAVPAATVALLSLFPRWSAAAKLLIVAGLGLAAWRLDDRWLLLALASAAAFLTPAVQKLDEWERAIVLRFGNFRNVRGPGLHILLPFVDRVARVVDLRIRVTDFAAETTLTRDSVTVTVDALCFWLVWDAEKAVCEVQDYEEAVVLSSKTALRNAVSKNDLSVFLERGDEIEQQIRAEVDRKTTEWGITVQHIEITDIQVPAGLQDSLSRLAQAEREKKGRILLAEAEIEVARKFEEAARIYGGNAVAMKLKSLSVLNEGLKAGNSMVLVPNSITEELKSEELFGLEALAENRKRAKEDGDDSRQDS